MGAMDPHQAPPGGLLHALPLPAHLIGTHQLLACVCAQCAQEKPEWFGPAVRFGEAWVPGFRSSVRNSTAAGWSVREYRGGMRLQVRDGSGPMQSVVLPYDWGKRSVGDALVRLRNICTLVCEGHSPGTWSKNAAPVLTMAVELLRSGRQAAACARSVPRARASSRATASNGRALRNCGYLRSTSSAMWAKSRATQGQATKAIPLERCSESVQECLHIDARLSQNAGQGPDGQITAMQGHNA